MVIDVTATGRTGFWWSRQLASIGQDVEMAALSRIVLIPGLATFGNELTALTEGILRINREKGRQGRSAAFCSIGPAFFSADCRIRHDRPCEANPRFRWPEGGSVPMLEAAGFPAAEP